MYSWLLVMGSSAQGCALDRSCHRTIRDVSSLEAIVKEIASEHSGRYKDFLRVLVKGFQKTRLDMFRWIAWALTKTHPDELKAGISQSQLFNRIKEEHPNYDTLQTNNVLHCLRQLAKLQQQKNVRPIILDYDSNVNEIQVVDSGFILYIQEADKEELAEIVSLGK